MKFRTNVLKFALSIFALIGLFAAATATAASSETAAGNNAHKPGIAVENDFQLLIRGFDNIGYEGEILDLYGTSCSPETDDLDYGIKNLGNNNNQMSSIALSNTAGCNLHLYDGPDWTGNYTIIPVAAQTGGCPNLGNCFGHNLWKRINSLLLT